MRDLVGRVGDQIGRTEDKMIEILIELQNRSEFNYLSKEDVKSVSELLDVSETKVFGIANFYSMLSTEKRGRNVIQICNSAPCYIRNGNNIVKIFEDILGIEMGEVTNDEQFSLEFTSCLGNCDVAPAVRVNEKTYGNLDRSKIFNMLASIKRGEVI